MRKERIIATIVIPVLAVVVAILEFLFGPGILRNHKIDIQSNDQANISTSKTNPNDNTTELSAKPTEPDSKSESTSQSEVSTTKPQEDVSQDRFVTVPNLLRMEQMEAKELLELLGLEFQVWWTEENDADSNVYYIIDQSIPSGSTVPAGSLIRLELSVKKP